MDSYKKAVDDFFDVYEQHNVAENLELRTQMSIAKNENVLTVFADHGQQMIIRVKDEDSENMWRRGAEELKNYYERNKVAPVQQKGEKLWDLLREQIAMDVPSA